MIPRATYRLQFHKGFIFQDAGALAPYLKALGVSDIYASPIFTARAGSTHGYDVIDPTRINPELGGEDGFRAMAAALRRNGLGLIVDIVPNHMAVGGADNPWWLDVLEKGCASAYAAMFDIDWAPVSDPALRGKVLAPFLGKPPEEALNDGDIALLWDDDLGKLAFAYAEHRFPLRAEDYATILHEESRPRPGQLDAWNTPDNLRSLLDRQHYVLAFWKTARARINWRCFFDIIGLAALRMEDETVFDAVHAKLFRLYTEGLVDGVRADHIDGLTDPRTYCRRLRARLTALEPLRPTDAKPGRAYFVVEKILADDEELPRDWETDGTTGYDFMNDVSALQHDGRGEFPLTLLWTRLSARPPDFETEEREARHDVLRESFAVSLQGAATAFYRLALAAAGDVSKESLETALALILEHFRAYRTYATGGTEGAAAGPFFAKALDAAMREASGGDAPAFTLIANAMEGACAEYDALAHEAVRRFNQLAAPLAAKAVEDTAFFRYTRLLSRNDVGFSPGVFSCFPADFAARVARRWETTPHALLATATHDHKRGEDVRARLAVLSEIPAAWENEMRAWFDLNAPLRDADLEPADEYRLYQTLVGTWPPELRPEHGAALSAYAARIQGWRRKSLREAKLRTSWTDPDTDFEGTHAEFVRGILDFSRSRAFLERLAAFAYRIGPAGTMNGLAQVLLRCTLPGVPDLYQGTEFWDFSLTDPDNRRAVDYPARIAALGHSMPVAARLAQWPDGRVKQSLIARLLDLRARETDCFAFGSYEPLEIAGPGADNIIAFLRRHEDTTILVAAPRLCAKACIEAGLPRPASGFWRDTAIMLPHFTGIWGDRLGGATVTARESLLAETLFADFPGAVLVHRP
jgi:(1->4)-alpha-D-glucan 1-alpha-D-glucosylmutase